MAVLPAFRQAIHVMLTVLDEAKFQPKTGERPASLLGEKVSSPLPRPQKPFIKCLFMQPEA